MVKVVRQYYVLQVTRTSIDPAMESCVHHQGSPSNVTPPHSAHDHPLVTGRAEQEIPASGDDIPYQNVASAPTSALVEMLSRIDALEAIPRLQVGL